MLPPWRMRRRLKSSATVCLIVNVSHLFLAEAGVCVALGQQQLPAPVGGPGDLRVEFFSHSFIVLFCFFLTRM